jgi:hypothetical protein
MMRNINPIYGVILVIIAAIFIAIAIYDAMAAPSLDQVRRAANLYPGRSVDIAVDGQIIHVTFVSIQQLNHGRYAIIVNAR